MAQTHTIDIDAALKAEQERLNSRKKELETELSEINGKLGRINRYFSEEPQDPFKLTPSLPSRDRRERGYVQDKVKATIYSHPEGITSGELTRALEGISGRSIQNALSGLHKGNQIIKDGARGGKYRPITLGPTPSTEAEAPYRGVDACWTAAKRELYQAGSNASDEQNYPSCCPTPALFTK